MRQRANSRQEDGRRKRSFFTVLVTTNILLPVSNWTFVGVASNVGGPLRFYDPQYNVGPQRFYTLGRFQLTDGEAKAWRDDLKAARRILKVRKK